MLVTEVHEHGPLFDGAAETELERGIEEARARIADEGARLARQFFAGDIRQEHGRFLASVTTTRDSRTYSTQSGRHTYTMAVAVDRATETAVTTDLASYGPWLEGVGSRNESTRFKGYHGFRRAGQELDQQASRIADEALHPYVAEVNA